ncbi:4Fe-4S binding protein [Thiovibrio sp. JS02]
MEAVRKWFQVVVAFLLNSSWTFPFTRTIYQGPLKVICAPGLNCYSCPAATTYCPMGSIQQLMGNLRFALENGQHYFGFSVIGIIGVLGGMFGRMICGWACPFGFIQEVLHKIPTRKFRIPRILSHGKFMFLVMFVFVLPLVLVDEFGAGNPWFCKFVCPAGTLEAGLPMILLQPNLRNSLGLLFLNKFVILIACLVWAIFSSRPFCRTMCPLGAFYALFSRVRLIRLHLDETKCTNCKACHHVCPMGVKFNESPDDTECITCLACMNKACKFDAISLEIGGIPLAVSEKKLSSTR